MIKTKLISSALLLALAVPAKADVIGAPIFVVQAISGIITLFASSSEYKPTQLLTVSENNIFVDAKAFKKKTQSIETFLFYQCQNWDENKALQKSERRLLNKSFEQLFNIEGAHYHIRSKKHAAILLFAIQDFSNTHLRKSSFGGPFKKSQWSSEEFKSQLEHKGCDDHKAYEEIKAWSDAHGFPFFK